MKISGRKARVAGLLGILAMVLLVGCDADRAGGAGVASAAEYVTPSGGIFIGGLSGSAAAPSDTIDLRQIGYSLGAEDAPVVVYEFSDFGCPFCAMFARGTLPDLHEEFIETGIVRWTYVPFVMGNFPNGAEAARAAECAGAQNRFWEMHDLLYARQNDWKSTRNPTNLFNGYADELDLERGQFSSCYRQNQPRERTDTNNRAAAALRVRATPSFFINGRMIEGALPAEVFRDFLRTTAAESSASEQ